MRLKTIRIFGFKSFADKTEIDVDGDLVAVVGPNGCGKSNLVDALLWALGEPSARNLRAQTSTDIIFGGSAKRKPLGYAEVLLTFDNEDGTLPLQSNEVIVGRKVDRSGESLYSINGRACRLRDIYELFADSGLGRTGYAIVGQKEIDASLSASPEERRIWLDEAAGVQRYRTRKHEALKRLESAIVHLTRVNDVLREIEIQREPLQKEAEDARLYKQKLGSLREVESGLLILEAAKLKEQIDNLEAQVSEKHKSAEEHRNEAEALDKQHALLDQKLATLDSAIENLSNKLQDAIANEERAESRKALVLQRIDGLDELDANRETESASAQARLERAKAAVKIAEDEATEAAQSVRVLLQVISGSQEQATKLGNGLKDAEARLQLAREAAVARIHHDAKVNQLKEQLSGLKRQLEGAIEAVPELDHGLNDATTRHTETTEQLKQARAQSEALHKERGSHTGDFDALEKERRTLLAEKAQLEGRVQGLRAAIHSHDGMPAGARAVLEATEKGTLRGEFVPVSSAIHVPAELAAAIEAALGSSANDLLTSKSDFAKQAIKHLRENGLGRATFLANDLISPRQKPPGIEKLASKPGVKGIASNLVKFDRAHSTAIENLLGGVLIVENVDVATQIAKETGFRKIATLDGEVLFAGGALTGGRFAKQSAGPIRLSAELDQAENRLTALQTSQDKLDQKRDELLKQEEKLAEQEKQIRDVVRDKEIEVTEALQWLTAVREERSATERAVSRLQTEIAEIEKEIGTESQRVIGESDSVDELETERNELLALSAASAADVDQARKALEEATERERASQRRLQIANEEQHDATEAIKHREFRLQNIGAERERQQTLLQEAEQELAQTKTKRESAAQELEEKREERKTLQLQGIEYNEKAKSLRESSRLMDDAAYRDDITRARAETRRAGTLARLLEEYAIDEDDAIKQAPLVVIPPDAQKLATELRRELKALGDVNLGAIEAYDRLTERFDILSRERADILESKSELDKSIHELDQLTRGAFTETFEKVNIAFGEMFTTLFGGGTAQLKLTQPDNILETGVDVEVQIPGKKTQRLELLSGGERALSACAFLFALFRVKPSPLCVLDELDAPLDGRNVERYVGLLKEFAKTSQFIVITHNPTTIEAAPIWFGVTMQEPGISTVVPYRVKEPRELLGTG